MNETQLTQNPEPTAAPLEPVGSVAPVTPEAQPAEPQAPAPQAYQYSPEEIQQLEAFAVQAARRLQEIQPYEDDLKRLQSDEQYREFTRTASRYYDENRKQAQPQQTQGQLPEEITEVLSYVREQRARETAQAEQQRNTFVMEQRRVGERMRRDLGLNDTQLGFLADTADRMAQRAGRHVGLEEAYSTVSSFAPRAGNTPPTVGLRGDASTPGVPGPSSDRKEWLEDFHGTLSARIRAAQNNA